MSRKDLDRLHILKKVLDGELKQNQAAYHLKISDRQVRKLLVRLKKDGEVAITSKLVGRPSNRSKSLSFKRISYRSS